MNKVYRYVTYDGMLHLEQKAAEKHLDKIYGDKLLHIGRLLTHQSYTYVTEWIDKNLVLFEELRRIKADMKCEDPDGAEGM